jgi:hypothetical protein
MKYIFGLLCSLFILNIASAQQSPKLDMIRSIEQINDLNCEEKKFSMSPLCSITKTCSSNYVYHCTNSKGVVKAVIKVEEKASKSGVFLEAVGVKKLEVEFN